MKDCFKNDASLEPEVVMNEPKFKPYERARHWLGVTVMIYDAVYATTEVDSEGRIVQKEWTGDYHVKYLNKNDEFQYATVNEQELFRRL